MSLAADRMLSTKSGHSIQPTANPMGFLSSVAFVLNLNGHSIQVLEIDLWLVFANIWLYSHSTQLVGSFIKPEIIQSNTKMVNSRRIVNLV